MYCPLRHDASSQSQRICPHHGHVEAPLADAQVRGQSALLEQRDARVRTSLVGSGESLNVDMCELSRYFFYFLYPEPCLWSPVVT